MERAFRLRNGRVARVRFTTAADGDLRVSGSPAPLARRRARLVKRPWTWLDQAHGSDAVLVERAGDRAGVTADAAVAPPNVDDAVGGAVLAIHTADCPPIALLSPEGVLGAVHAGWRGLEGGIVDATLTLMRNHNASAIRALLGPCIHVECYEFGASELDGFARRFGSHVRGITRKGTPALDLPGVVATALRRGGVDDLDIVPRCTACDPRFFSHRARSDGARQAMLVWLE